MTRLTSLPSERLISDFVLHAERYGQHLLEKNKKADRHVDRANDIVRELRVRGPAEIRLLLPLLSPADGWVRLSAAAHLVHEEPGLAVPVLRELAAGSEWCSISARLILQVWESGALQPV